MTDTLLIHPAYRTGTWVIDPAHSELAFSVRHLAISRVRGAFRSFEVTVVTTEDPQQIAVEASVDVASVDTNQPVRDAHLRSSDFFLVEQHPTMTFRSTGIEGEPGDFRLHGELTLRGVTRPVTLRGEVTGTTTDASGRERAGVTASTTINRHDFGVSWNQALEAGGFTLGDDVRIDIDLQLVLQG